MKKRFLSLLCVLALCLGLLPVTALAVGPNTVYVGGVELVGSPDNIVYATTNESGEVVKDGANANNYNIKWDGSTLTLHDATIQKELYASDLPLSNIAGAAIGVINQSGDAGLTVQLEGNNKIEGVSTGIHVRSSGGNAALNITGNGTLVVNSNYPTIQAISIGGNAALSIENAKVTATSSYSNVVTVESNSSENSTLTVNGGCLIATAQSNNVSGIRLRGTGETGGSSPTVTVSNNAIVRANGSAGGITSDSSTGVQYGTGSSTTGGIVFDGNTGTVYGDVELQNDLEIKSGETLTIPEGSTLTVPDDKTLTNNGTINVENGGNLEGEPTSGSGTVVNAPTITGQPKSQTVAEGQTATFTVEANGENLSYQWQQSINSGSSWTDISGANAATYTTAATTTSMNGYQYCCVASNSAGSVTSEVATLTVNEPAPTTYTITADVTPSGAGTATSDKTTATAGDTVKLTATANSGYRFTGWTFSDNITDADSSSASTTFTMPAGEVTVTAKFEQVYTVTVSSTAGGTATADKATAAAGETVTLTATPDSGYHFDGWNIVPNTVTIQDNQFTMPAGNVEIQAIFDRYS